MNTVGKATAVAGLVGSVIGGWLVMDGRWANAQDFERYKAEDTARAAEQEQQTVQTIQNLQQQIVADELNKLEAKEQLDPQGLTRYDEVRKKQLERQWEQMTK